MLSGGHGAGSFVEGFKKKNRINTDTVTITLTMYAQ
jgi:hypothetical protein